MNMGKSETPWPVFRPGEIYPNLAEAAVELGRNAEALQAVNAVRERAGMLLLTGIDMAKVRHERKIELAFEGHRFRDMKRWRIAHPDAEQGGLNGFRGTALHPYNPLIFTQNTTERTKTRKYSTAITGSWSMARLSLHAREMSPSKVKLRTI
jgi:hypothetical protein